MHGVARHLVAENILPRERSMLYRKYFFHFFLYAMNIYDDIIIPTYKYNVTRKPRLSPLNGEESFNLALIKPRRMENPCNKDSRSIYINLEAANARGNFVAELFRRRSD